MISIIIPAYKAEVTLGKCLRSIEDQSYKDYEVIVIKDVLGVSRARNQGIEKAKGELIFFLDADDILTENALALLAKEQADLIISGYNPQTVKDYLMAPNKNTAFAFCWGKLFKTKIIKDNHILFLPGMDKHEDTEFVFHYLHHAQTVKFMKEKIVIHIQPETGKGMEEFDAGVDRTALIKTIRRLVDDKDLLANCQNILRKVDLVRACRKGNIFHPVLTFRAWKRYTPIVIFGTGSTAGFLFEECRKTGVRVECFCDEVEKLSFYGMRVLNLNELKALFPSARIMPTTSNLKDIVERLDGKGFRKILYRKTARLLKKIKTEGYSRFCLENCIEAIENRNNKMWMRSLDLMITERCSLNCRDCSNLMPHYKNPVDLDTSEVLCDFDRVSQMYKIGEVRVIGGEPFINKNWPKVVSYLVNSPRVKRIVIYTNGTIPAMDDCLKSKKVIVAITDYGELSKALSKMTLIYRAEGVSHFVQKAEWTDCGKIEKHARVSIENDYLFSRCCSKNTTLSNGNLYDCAFAANLSRLGWGDYFGSEACEYCSGRPLNAPKITPAIQEAK